MVWIRNIDILGVLDSFEGGWAIRCSGYLLSYRYNSTIQFAKISKLSVATKKCVAIIFLEATLNIEIFIYFYNIKYWIEILQYNIYINSNKYDIIVFSANLNRSLMLKLSKLVKLFLFKPNMFYSF